MTGKYNAKHTIPSALVVSPTPLIAESNLVSAGRLELPCPRAPDPKSGASAYSATPTTAPLLP